MGEYIKRQLNEMDEKKDWTDDDFEYFNKVIQFIQHERLIHLMVTIVTGGLFFIFMAFMVLIDSIITALLFFAVTILLVCYIKYYCFVENSVQKMYYIYDERTKALHGEEVKDKENKN
jgi:cytochrome b subunit of formate dehydrogenase